MASTWLDDELGRGEQGGQLADHPGRPLRVNTAREDQHGRAERGGRGPGSSRIKRSRGGEATGRILIDLRFSRGPIDRRKCALVLMPFVLSTA
jgi:hypothetical protein